MPLHIGGSTYQSFNTAVRAIKRSHPSWSDERCRRYVGGIFQRQEGKPGPGKTSGLRQRAGLFTRTVQEKQKARIATVKKSAGLFSSKVKEKTHLTDAQKRKIKNAAKKAALYGIAIGAAVLPSYLEMKMEEKQRKAAYEYYKKAYQGYAKSNGGNRQETPWWQYFGVSRNATPQEMRRAYRKKSLDLHPDRGGSHEKMTECNRQWEAYRRDRRIP